jgi:hypothetical protein
LSENEFPTKFEIKREVADELTDFQFKICSIDKTIGFSATLKKISQRLLSVRETLMSVFDFAHLENSAVIGGFPGVKNRVGKMVFFEVVNLFEIFYTMIFIDKIVYFTSLHKILSTVLCFVRGPFQQYLILIFFFIIPSHIGQNKKKSDESRYEA